MVLEPGTQATLVGGEPMLYTASTLPLIKTPVVRRHIALKLFYLSMVVFHDDFHTGTETVTQLIEIRAASTDSTKCESN